LKADASAGDGMIIRSARELEERFEELGRGDVFIGSLPAKYLRGALAADLMERGVRCVPAVLCQLISRSKCAQAFLFRQWLAPHTRVIARRAELMEAVGYCARNRIGAVVTKQEGMHCGHGIRRWDSAEVLYNTVAFTDSAYPFVLQPFLPDITDVRVIVVGDYVEAYLRENLFNFRANLAAGGASRPLAMDAAAERLCRAVMERGRFPYAHIDLHLTVDGHCWLSEVTLDGGIAAARITRQELERRKQEMLERLALGERVD
jgi:glutathione synthase/RimK-type ligase-like ATP-grasp enzyme